VEPESVQFYVQNELKLTYEHLKFEKYSGVIPGSPLKGRGGKGGRKGKGGD
jgi:hypothetical protein